VKKSKRESKSRQKAISKNPHSVSKPGLNLGGFDDWEDTDPVYNLDTTLGKCSLSKRVTLSPLSYHRAGNKYNLERWKSRNNPKLFYNDTSSCFKKGVDPYNIVDKRTMITKSKRECLNRIHAKHKRSDWLRSSDPTSLASAPLSHTGKPTVSSSPAAAKFKTVSLAEKVLRSPEKYSASFSGTRFTGEKFSNIGGEVPETYHPNLGPGKYRIYGTTLEVKESEKKSPTYRSGVPRFSAFGTSRNTKGYFKRKNWSKKYMKERFRFHAPTNVID